MEWLGPEHVSRIPLATWFRYGAALHSASVADSLVIGEIERWFGDRFASARNPKRKPSLTSVRAIA